jgi:cell division protein ZapA
MLLMAGLMLADKTAGLEEKLREVEAEAAKIRAQVEMLQSQPTPAPERVEVPVVPREITDTLSELAARAEALADQVEVSSK